MRLHAIMMRKDVELAVELVQMSVFLSEMHLWSLKNTLHIEDQDIGLYHYYDKKEPDSPVNFGYLYEKQQLATSRDYPWVLKNKRPEKLRDTLKELEELMQNSQCVLSKWKNKYVCQLLFHSGVLVSLSLSGPQLERVVIDRTLVGKLISDTISDAVLTDSFMILSFSEQSQLCFIQFTKKANSPDVNKKPEKLSSLDFKISYVDIPGQGSRSMKHHLAINCVQDMVICWWSVAKDEVWPWSPVPNERERANLMLLRCEHGSLEVLNYVRTNGDPLDIGFSTKQPYQIHTVECSFSADQEPMADSCIYECVRNKIQCVAVIKIPLKSKAISCCRNISEDKLVLGCEDSSIVLYEAYRQVTLLAQAELLPALLCCHPSGAIVMVGSSQGELQLFDMALSPMKMQLLAEDFTPKRTLQFSEHFDVFSSLIQIQWAAPQLPSPSMDDVNLNDLLLIRFDKGPIGVLHFKAGVFPRGQLGLVEIIQEYIHQDEMYEAINILSGMNWNTMGHQCYVSLSAIVNHLLRQKLTPAREAQLEASLGTFYAPTRPLSETTVLEYRDPLSRYARRFFHHLLRYQRFEKAFLLAVDIGAHDLFMDIHYFALDKGELALAEVAKKKANDIDTESITTGIEIPGQADIEDVLNETFVDLTVLPQEEQNCQGNLPPSVANACCFTRTTNNSSGKSEKAVLSKWCILVWCKSKYLCLDGRAPPNTCQDK
ncbi:WD repeat-containing and planar cell polarity effector protein fritz homolog isoform X3 [Hemicordylus capensis]|uniref:WD repeat-containing and planar cell polarity effector protein fritz homolog isoform X3 n=1 Tax=Hemicordylus capensis TaxID=884348 RepID=UPI002303C909|nr:WD repeat-containing and planar cell polarity effector protein fritz homolog isoform X3 [Hemicordylus capensis]